MGLLDFHIPVVHEMSGHMKETIDKTIEHSEKEIAARDRVDISLAEYEDMKKQIADLRGKLNGYRNIFGDIPDIDKLVIIGGVDVFTCHDPIKRIIGYDIRFTVEDFLRRTL